MKKILRYSIVTVLILAAGISQAQVTKMANNNNIVYGIPLGDIGLMIDDQGHLWKTDGTQAGTNIYTTKVIKDTSEQAAFLNNKVYFSGVDLNGAELWVSDGTDAGTSMVKDINPSGTAPRQNCVQ